jgi:hypothetical protein
MGYLHSSDREMLNTRIKALEDVEDDLRGVLVNSRKHEALTTSMVEDLTKVCAAVHDLLNKGYAIRARDDRNNEQARTLLNAWRLPVEF